MLHNIAIDIMHVACFMAMAMVGYNVCAPLVWHPLKVYIPMTVIGMCLLVSFTASILR